MPLCRVRARLGQLRDAVQIGRIGRRHDIGAVLTQDAWHRVEVIPSRRAGMDEALDVVDRVPHQRTVLGPHGVGGCQLERTGGVVRQSCSDRPQGDAFAPNPAGLRVIQLAQRAFDG